MREQKKKITGFRRTYWTVFLVTCFFLHIFLQAPSLLFIIYTYYYTLVSIYKRPTRCVFAVGPRVKNKTHGAQFSITRTPIYCVLWWFFTLFSFYFTFIKHPLSTISKNWSVSDTNARAHTQDSMYWKILPFFFFYVISKNQSRGLTASMRAKRGASFRVFCTKKHKSW